MPNLRIHRAAILAAVAVPIAVYAAAAWQNRTDVLSANIEEASRTAAVMREHAERVFDTADLLLGRIEEQVADKTDAQIANPLTSDYLARLQHPLAQVLSAWISDKNGVILAGSSSFNPAVTIEDREWFVTHAQGFTGTIISRPFVGKATAAASFAVSRARIDEQGNFQGVVHLALDPRLFQQFFAESGPRFRHSATLIRQDGTLLAGWPQAPVNQRAAPNTALVEGIARSPDGGMVTGLSPDLTDTRLSVFRPVENRAIYVVLAADFRDILGVWYRNLIVFGIVATLAVALLTTVATLSLRRALSERQALKAATEAGQLKLDTERRLRQSQKMEAVGQLTGGIAHDFNNQLTVVLGSLHLMQRRMAKGAMDVDRYLLAALEGGDKLARLTSRLMVFSRQHPIEQEPFDPCRVVNGMLEMINRAIGPTIVVESACTTNVWPTKADANQLENALLNLAVNARDAMPTGGIIRITARNREFFQTSNVVLSGGLKPGEYIEIAVTDDGVGMAQDVASRAFEPFFTTKRIGEGSGLGLAQVYGFAQQSGGGAEIESRAGHGTRVSIFLPRYHGTVLPISRGTLPADAAPMSGGETVIVVDDDPDMRQTSAAALEELGFRTIATAYPTDVRRLLDENTDVVLVFSDVMMPDMDGRTLAAKLEESHPHVPVLLTTGFAGNIPPPQGAISRARPTLRKPFALDNLAAAVKAALPSRDNAVHPTGTDDSAATIEDRRPSAAE